MNLSILTTAPNAADPSWLQIFWFIIIGVLWTGFFVLEGFDFGVGSLLGALGKGKDAQDTERRRRVMLNTIGPFWDGNEVWLLTAGGATFAAFPDWYATLFAAGYLALFLVLAALIVRAMGLEYRHKRNSDAWRKGWDWAIMLGSGLTPLLLGVALTNVAIGMKIGPDKEYTGNFIDLLINGNGITLIGGLTILSLSLTHGAIFLALKTDGKIREDARALATKLGLVTAVLAVILLLWVNMLLSFGSIAVLIATVLAAVFLLTGIWFNMQGREGLAFIFTALTFAMAVANYFLALWAQGMSYLPSNIDPAYSLTIANHSSSELTLKIMTGAALVFTPIVLIYSAWTYWIFRKRLTVEMIPEATKVK